MRPKRRRLRIGSSNSGKLDHFLSNPWNFRQPTAFATGQKSGENQCARSNESRLNSRRPPVNAMIHDDEFRAARSDKRDDEGSIDEAILRQQAIGVKLRQMFDQVVGEPVPDDFLDILRRADEKAGGRSE